MVSQTQQSSVPHINGQKCSYCNVLTLFKKKTTSMFYTLKHTRARSLWPAEGVRLPQMMESPLIRLELLLNAGLSSLLDTLLCLLPFVGTMRNSNESREGWAQRAGNTAPAGHLTRRLESSSVLCVLNCRYCDNSFMSALTSTLTLIKLGVWLWEIWCQHEE